MNPAAALDAATISPRRQPGRLGWLLMTPLLLWLAVFVIAPTIILFAYSFGKRDGIGQVSFHWRDPIPKKDAQGVDLPPRIIAFDNYKTVFDPIYLEVIGLSALWGIGGAAVLTAFTVVNVWCRRWRVAQMASEDDAGPTRDGEVLDYRRNMLTTRWPVRRFIKAAIWGLVIGFAIGFDYQIEQVTGGTPLKILWRSAKYAAYTTAWCIALGYPVAYFIGRASETNRNRLLMLVMIPFWTSFLIRTYAWITILKEQGLLNSFLNFSGLTTLLANLAQFEFVGQWFSYRDEPYITANGELHLLYTPAAIMIGLVYSYLPFMILPIYGSVEKLDNALVEAAFDLGAGPVRAFQHVIIPLTQPGIVAGCLLVFIPAIGMFAIQDLLGGRSVQMIGNVIQVQFIGQARNWPYGAALGMTLVAMFVFVFWLSSRKEEET